MTPRNRHVLTMSHAELQHGHRPKNSNCNTWLRWQRFPNTVVRVDGIGNEVGSKQMPGFPPMPVDIMTLKVHITNAEADRNVSIRAAYLLVKSKSGFALHEQLFSAPSDPVSYTPLDRAFEFRVNLAPQAS